MARVISEKESQLEKAPSPMSVTVPGMERAVRPEELKPLLPMDVSPSGSVRVERFLAP